MNSGASLSMSAAWMSSSIKASMMSCLICVSSSLNWVTIQPLDCPRTKHGGEPPRREHVGRPLPSTISGAHWLLRPRQVFDPPVRHIPPRLALPQGGWVTLDRDQLEVHPAAQCHVGRSPAKGPQPLRRGARSLWEHEHCPTGPQSRHALINDRRSLRVHDVTGRACDAAEPEALGPGLRHDAIRLRKPG